jgi:hypothetical protein
MNNVVLDESSDSCAKDWHRLFYYYFFLVNPSRRCRAVFKVKLKSIFCPKEVSVVWKNRFSYTSGYITLPYFGNLLQKFFKYQNHPILHEIDQCNISCTYINVFACTSDLHLLLFLSFAKVFRYLLFIMSSMLSLNGRTKI